MRAPLEGVRVVEAASWLAAPCAAALMADLGASVVKIEPPGGDSYRHGVGRSPSELHPTFELDNRGKRSITIDLSRPGAGEVMRRLLSDADVFITNFIRRRQEQYGLTPEAVHAFNPRIIYASFSGYGTDGPEGDRIGFDFSAFWARGGVQALLGEPEAPPPPCRPGQGDHVTALNLLASVLAALRLRDLTGEGQTVDVTLVGTGVWSIGSDVSAALASRARPARHDRRRPPNPLRNPYRCRDGRWVMLNLNTQNYWPGFCRAIERPQWEHDPRFATLEARAENTAQLASLLDGVFAAHDAETWHARLDRERLVWAPVAELPEVIEDKTLRALGTFTRVEHPVFGSYETLSAPFHIRGADVAVRGPAPAAGQHTLEVLADAGFDEDEVADLATQGVFG
jgi:crotonobetainyl-CoA:carnitine CoA-transferase CaiB-like acyl-CoA transferase